MVHLSLSQSFLVLVSKPSLLLLSLSPRLSPLSPPPQHSACLQLVIILALIRNILRDADDMFGTCTKDSQSLSLGTPDEEGHPLKFLKLGWGTTAEQAMQNL
jgi:hypothetical protein